MLTKNIEEMKIAVAAHIAADQVVQGHYWDNERGCFIGCLTHSGNALAVTEKYGMPLPLVDITESVFEGLPEEEAVQFFADIPDAIGADGKDLSLVHWQFLRDTLKRLPEITPETQTVIDGISLLAEGKEWSAKAAKAAYWAAEAAANTAASPAYCAAKAARAASDAACWEAEAAYWAAYWAAIAVHAPLGTRAAYAAIAEERRKQAGSIIQLLKEAPLKEAIR